MGRATIAAAALLALFLVFIGRGAALGGSYSQVVFSDGFESGTLSAWNGTAGTGSATVVAGSAHSGSFGLRLANSGSQSINVVEALPNALVDSSVKFWVRVAAGSTVETIAQARDNASSAQMWVLQYDAKRQGLILFPYKGSTSTQIFTGANTVTPATWFQVEIQYTATAVGGAQLYINGATKSGWGVTGDYTRSTNLQRLQLWNDGVMPADFDDVTVAVPSPGVPGTPTNVTGTRGNASVALSWTAPTSDGGSAITGYRVTPFIGSTAQTTILTGSAATTYTVTGLTNGTAYTFKVAAANAVGAGPNSAASAAVTPATVPGAPTAVTGTAGNGQVALSWTAPTSTGGSAITGYRVTPYIGTTAQTSVLTGSTATSYTVTGLTNGSAYTFKVAAINAAGTGLDSAASPALTPQAAVPGAPTGVTGTAGDSSVALSWTAPASNGGSSITGYAVTPYVGGTAQAAVLTGSTATTFTVTGLTNGTAYTFTVAAINSVGTGPQSAASAAVTPAAATTAPGAPTGVAGTPGNGQVALSWTAPASNGGSAITGYRVTPYIGGTAQTPIPTGSTSTSYTVTGLTNGTAYTFTVAATNSVGTGPESGASAAVTPATAATVPDAPTNVTGTAGDASVALSWTAPASNGGSAITGYLVTPRVGGVAQGSVLTGSTATTFTVTGLTNGTAYTFTVAAINAVGTGADSAPSAAVTPAAAATPPGAPTGVAATAGDASAFLSWTAPSSSGGSAITGYRVTPWIGAAAQTPIATGSTSTAYTVTGLTNGTAYTFTVAAINAVGTGVDSAASAAVTPVDPPATTYGRVVFSDGFESGSLSAWDGGAVLGSGTASVVAGSAHTGGFGLSLSNATGQFADVQKTLGSALPDSSTSFWVRFGSVAGVRSVAQARDQTSSAQMWGLLYDGTRHGMYFYPYRGTTSTEIFTGNDTAPAGQWIKVEVQYTATTTGGAHLFINGQTQPGWSMSGDYSRATNYQRLQLWNDAVDTTNFDDVQVAMPGAPPTAPGAPTNVAGTAGDRQVALSWTAPASDGGTAITGYRITPYVGGTAQTPISTGSSATSSTVTGLTNGTTYTFTVAAINAVGTGPESAASSTLTPAPAPPSVPGPPTGVSGAPGDGQAALSWTAPTLNGGSPITGYAVTPSIGGVAQAPVLTGSAATSFIVTGLTNGTAYTFTVAAINAAGTGPQSAASAAITPRVGTYGRPVFSDGFESGSLSAWDGSAVQGTGAGTAVAAAAHTGGFGLRLSNTSGQFALVQKTLPSTLPDSSTSFWVRFGSATGVRTVIDARDSASQRVWGLLYDGSRQGFYFYPYRGTTNTEIFTGNNTAPVGQWIKVEVQYTATTTGGAQLFINGQTQAAWGVSGDYSRTADYQRLQLWDDVVDTSDFDDVQVAAPGSAPTVPAAPSGVAGTAGDDQVSLTWTASSSDGGSPITGYAVTPYVSGVAQAPVLTGSPATNFTVTGLTDGTTYTFTVAAINAVGTGPQSAPSSPITPIDVETPPSAPTNVSGTGGDGSAVLSWTAPASTGGTPVTTYRVTPYVGGTAQTAIVTGSAGTTFTVTGLTNGTAYTFTVAATNSIGTGPDSAPSAPITPAASRYPTVVFSDGFESGTLSAWDSSSGSASVVAAAAHAGGLGLRLSNSASGQFAVAQKTFPSALPDSSTSFWVRFGTVSGIRSLVQARDQASSNQMWGLLYDGTQHGLYFYPYRGTTSTEIFTGNNTAPAGQWLKVEVQYTATTSGGAKLFINGQTQPGWAVSGDYSRATNYQRLQLWNDAVDTTDFDDVQVAAPAGGAASVPGAPTSVTGTPGNGSVSLSWTAPTSDGGSAITGYRVTPHINGTAQTATLTGSPATSSTVNGLTNGTAYTFTVAAINAVGTGPESTASASVTPTGSGASVPGAPTNVAGTPGDRQVVLSWTAPPANGSPITSYLITPFINGTGQTPVSTGSAATTFTVTGLTNGTAYTFTVAATNGVGTGPASTPSNSVTPQPPSPPSAPTSVAGAAGDSSVSLSWTAPTSNGSSPITGYRVTPSIGGTAQTPILTGSTATSYTVTGLTNGTAYTFTVAAINAIGNGPDSAPSPPVTPAALNAIQAENNQPGDPNWGDFAAPPDPTGISGYGSKISVNHGDSIDFYVTTTASQVTINVYRMGWYAGAGARLMRAMGTFPGVNQPQATPNPTMGMVSENWARTTTLSVPSTWTTGVYMARLMASNGYGAMIFFVVRNDGGHEPILFNTNVNSYAAYDAYGGTSLYSNNTNHSIYSPPHAMKVSFDHPFLQGDGAGQFLWYEYPFVRWLEKQGYDVAYTTDLDIATTPGLLTAHKMLLFAGHAEYWTKSMRDNVQAAIAAGVNVAFFSGNESYWQVRYEANAAGVANRVVVGYKDFADCSCPPGPDPMWNVDNSVLTALWRNPLIGRPEEQMMGVQFGGEVNNANWTVQNASNWVYAGTGWTNGTIVPGIVGYEYDHFFNDANTPANITVLSNTAVVNTENGQHDTANATIYTAPSGARVFAAGTIQWSWGLDNYGGTSFVNAGVQRVTANILANFTG